jgi:hypothetical protein
MTTWVLRATAVIAAAKKTQVNPARISQSFQTGRLNAVP